MSEIGHARSCEEKDAREGVVDNIESDEISRDVSFAKVASSDALAQSHPGEPDSRQSDLHASPPALVQASPCSQAPQVSQLKRAVTQNVLPLLPVAPPMPEIKRAVSTPLRTPMDEVAALEAIKAIDKPAKLPSRQRTDGQRATGLSPLREGGPPKLGCAVMEVPEAPEGPSTMPLVTPQPKLTLADLPPLKVKPLPVPESMASPSAKLALSDLPPSKVEPLLSLLRQDARPGSSAKETPSPSPRTEAAVSDSQPLPLPVKNPTDPFAMESIRTALEAQEAAVLSPARSGASPTRSLLAAPILQSLSPHNSCAGSKARGAAKPLQRLPWLQVKSQPDPKAMKDQTMKDQSAPAALSCPMRRPNSSGDLRGGDSEEGWCALDERSEAPILPRRLPSGDHQEDRSLARKTKMSTGSDHFSQARERFYKEPSTPATLASRRGCRPKGPFRKQGSARDLYQALTADLDAPPSPRRRSTGDRPAAEAACDALGLSNSVHNGVEVRKNGFVRRGFGSRANLSLSPSRQTLGSSHERRARRKVASCDGDRIRPSIATAHQQQQGSNRYLPTDDALNKKTYNELEVSRHAPSTRAIRRGGKTREQQQGEGSPRPKVQYAEEKFATGKSYASPTSSISLESASFGYEDDKGRVQADEAYDGDGRGKSPPVEFVTFTKETTSKEPIHPVSGHSGHYSAQRPGLPPVFVEAGSGTKTTVDAEASLTWAYDPSTGTYKMVPMVTNAGMPWLCLCGQENEADFSFCGMCAQPQRWTCSHCNFQKNKCRFPHCGGCGARRAGGVDPQPPRPTFLAPVDPIY